MARRDIIRRGRDLVIKDGVDFMPISHLTELINDKIKSLHIRGYAKLSINNYQVGTLLREVEGVERKRERKYVNNIVYETLYVRVRR